MRRSFAFAIMVALFAACSTKEINTQTPHLGNDMFYASFEHPSDIDTKVYANEDHLLRWTADDRVSIFNKITYNQQYKFLGETGDNAGGFSEVSGASFVTGNEIPHVVSVYPYQEGTKITETEVMTLTLPAEQSYAESSFGQGANTMVSVSENNVLQFKNVGGYLVLKLYGEGVSVSSITLKGNNGEKLAGKATVTMPLDGTPAVALAEDATDLISLVCDTPIALGATAEESKDFWFVVPPLTFSQGFQVTVSGNGGVFEKATQKTVTIERNDLSKMSPIEVELSQPRNVIYYTSSDESVVTPYNPDAFGAVILSNEYVNGQGIITFDGDVTSIGDNAFSYCTSLTCITIPDSVTSIGDWAFYRCTSLTSISIPESVTSIGSYAFLSCTSLISIAIPDSVTNIGDRAFRLCSSLTSITIPDGVTSIGDYTFSCTLLTSITIPDSVTSIGSCAFEDCTSLTSISIPESVTSIGSRAFHSCSYLTSITIPDSVTSIGDGVFAGCTSLVSFSGKYASSDGLFLIDSGRLIAFALGSIGGDVTIPDGVTSIGDGTFYNCRSLTSITIPDSVTSIGSFAFQNCRSLTSITIPDSVTSIGNFAFSNCTSLTSITVLPETPPSRGTIMFSYTNDCPIYVPAESVEAYKTAPYWSDYANRIYAIGTPMAVDLGLSVKWASFNLGASKPEEFGDFYAWGETETKEYYDWDNYKWSNGLSLSASTNNYLTKYNSNSDYGLVDNKSVLDPEDDVAHVKLGSNWRIPTQQEFVELSQNCDWVRATVNGITGYLVKSRINSNSIFLYYSDWPYPKNLNDPNNDLIEGNYWSANSCNNPPSSAYRLLITPDGVFPNAYARRCHGRNIRPVYAE